MFVAGIMLYPPDGHGEAALVHPQRGHLSATLSVINGELIEVH